MKFQAQFATFVGEGTFNKNPLLIKSVSP